MWRVEGEERWSDRRAVARVALNRIGHDPVRKSSTGHAFSSLHQPAKFVKSIRAFDHSDFAFFISLQCPTHNRVRTGFDLLFMFPRAVSRAVNGRGALTSLRPTPTYSILTQHIHSRQAAPRWERLRTFGSLSGTWRQSVARNPQLFSSFLNLQHLRSASSNADRPTKAKGQNPNQGDVTKEDAESPWTEEPRSPAPGGGALGDNAEESSAPKYRSKLGTESETAEEVDSVTGKLPDLRYGIPSNFNAETSQTSDTSSSFKTEETPSRDLDITADPASGGGRGEEASPKEAYVSSIDRRRQALARWMYTAAAAFGLAAFAWLGRDWDSEAEANTHPDAPNGLSPIAWYYRFRERLGGQFSHYTEPAFPKLLPDPPSDPNQRMPYTLVLSLEDLLVTSTWTRQDGYKIAKRPGVDYFLRYLCQYYELVIFTTVQVANGDLVLRQLDPYQLCLPIFRDGTRYMNGEHVKVCGARDLNCN